jgi:NAD(P)-dependent dehydrogenase (short-subunit alcohol dehydrogenase family)
MNDLFSINNKIIIITGGSGGIGSELSNKMSEQGAIIYSLDKKFSKMRKNSKVIQKKCNILNKNQLKKVCKEIFEKHKKIDVLINCAGITKSGKSGNEYSTKDWRETIDVNLTGSFLTSQSVIKYMKKNKNGSIINITSINAELGFPNNPAYVASKGGLKMLTKSLAKDNGKFGIRVNNLGPGYIGTGMVKKSYKNKKEHSLRENHTILGRWGTTEDLVGPCIFLASNASNYITAQDIYVDGGWLSNGLLT